MTPLERDSLAGPLGEVLAGLPPRREYFSGLRLADGLTPDQILLFRRHDPAAFRPEGVNDNRHPRFELVVVLEHAGDVRIGQKSALLAPGEAALVFPNQFHHYLDVGPGPIEWLFITFELARPEQLSALKDTPRQVPAAAWPLMTELVALFARQPAGEAVAASALLSAILQQLLDAPVVRARHRAPDRAAVERDRLLEKVNRYVYAHLEQEMTIETLAVALGYSASHLRSLFRSRLGISLGRYIRESRLSEAAKRLRTAGAELSLEEVALGTGFGSVVAFSRAFKRAYGISPRRYARG